MTNILKDIFTFAWRDSGKFVLLSCVILSLLADLASVSPLFSFAASMLISAYFSATYYQLVQSSATGGQETPDFPEISSLLDDLAMPYFQIILTSLISFGPFLVYLIWIEQSSSLSTISFILLGFGIIYFPMAMLAVVILGYTTAISPHIVIPAVLRGGWIYWIGIAMLITLYIISSMIENLTSGSVIITHLIIALVGSYTFITNARILGIVYRERQEKLG